MSFLSRATAFLGSAAVAALLCLSSYGQVTINEVFAENETFLNPDSSISDWVELYNSSSQAVSLAGYGLTDTSSNPHRWVFPANIAIPATGYLHVLLDSGRLPSTSVGSFLNAGFSIKGTGDRIELYSPGMQLIDSIRFGPQAADLSIGRMPVGTGSLVLTTPTPGSGNISHPLGPQANLRVNEWMASPSAGNDWFEVYNPGELPVSLTGLQFTDNNNEPSPVAPLSYLGTGLNGYVRFFADNSTNDNEVDFGLSGSGDSIGMSTTAGVLIDRVQFAQQTADVSQGHLPDGSGPILSLNTATPGESNFVEYDGLVVNELLSHTDPPYEDAVEFYNSTDNSIDISGWYLSNSRTDLKRYKIPATTSVPSKGFLVIYEGQFNGPTAITPFTFNSAHGDQVVLAQANASDQLTGFLIDETFEAAENGVSFGSYQTSVAGDYKFVAVTSTTFGVSNPSSVANFRTGKGQTNSPPRVGPVVINEIMYNPISPDGGVTDNTDDEYIELLNITQQNVLLYDPLHPENRWRLRDGISFTFPESKGLTPGAFALVVSFDPAAEPAKLAAFRTKFSVPTEVQIFGPYSDKLANGGDSIELYKPDPPQGPGHPDEGFVPYIRVDKVNYFDAAPWPTGADGSGNSLQRKNAPAFGNDPINWEAATPSAGKANSADVADSDSDGMPNQWEVQYGLNPNDPADAAIDSDTDTFTNLQEYIAGTDPKNATSRLGITQITYPAGSSPAIRFSSVTGKSYSLQYRNNLQLSSVWQKLVSTNGTGSEITIQDSDAAGRSLRFYRLVTPAVD